MHYSCHSYRLAQYGALTDLLANGMRIHLQHNDLVRDVFHLGTPPVTHKLSKSDKIEKASKRSLALFIIIVSLLFFL